MNRFAFTILVLSSLLSYGQKSIFSDVIEIDFFNGNILAHSPDMIHLIKGHPEGQMISFVNRTGGEKSWHKLYNYPDYGYYLIHQDYKNAVLGQNYGGGLFFNFYFFNRNLSVKMAQGVAYNSNPHNKETNNKNTAFGSNFLFNTELAINFKRQNIFKNFGLQTGVFLTHFSNGRVKSPNSGINTVNLNVGIIYNIEKIKPKIDTIPVLSMKFTEPIRYNFAARFGVNENHTIGSGQKPFYHLTFYADKRINRKSALQLGVDAFFTMSKKDYIKYQSIAFPEKNIAIDIDYRRYALLVGHELFINKMSIETQIGYYVYNNLKYDPATYNRIGAKYYVNEKMFCGLAIKTHAFLAEAIELSIGYRL